MAILGGQRKIYELLVEMGISGSWGDAQRETALDLALRHGYSHLFSFDVEVAVENRCFTPLHLAVVLPFADICISEQLGDQEYRNVDAEDKAGTTPLHWACRKANSTAVKLLLEWRADPTVRDSRGWSALHHACWADDYDPVALLLSAGSRADDVDNDGKSALFALGDRGPNIVDLLLRQGAKKDRQDCFGYTALHWMARNVCVEAMSLLIARGANIDAQAKHGGGSTPIASAINKNRLHSVSALLKYAEIHKVRELCCVHNLLLLLTLERIQM